MVKVAIANTLIISVVHVAVRVKNVLMTETTMRNITIRTLVRALLEELDKIDPVWYIAEALGSIENSEVVYIAHGERTSES